MMTTSLQVRIIFLGALVQIKSGTLFLVLQSESLIRPTYLSNSKAYQAFALDFTAASVS